MPTRRRWFANSDDFRHDYGWHPATDCTFDIGFATVVDGRGWIAWFTDEG